MLAVRKPNQDQECETAKITKAMEMVAASKMRPGAAADAVCPSLCRKDPPPRREPFQGQHQRLQASLPGFRRQGWPVGIVVVTTDKGSVRWPEYQRSAGRAHVDEGDSGRARASPSSKGNRDRQQGLGFMQRLRANIISQAVQLGDTPHLDADRAGQVMLDAFQAGELDAVLHRLYAFINTMKQEPVLEQLLPLTGEATQTPQTSWDYLYEPDRDGDRRNAGALRRALDTQAVAENMASRTEREDGGDESRDRQLPASRDRELQLVI